MSAVDTVSYHVHFMKIGYSLPDAIHFLPDSTPRILEPPSASAEKGLYSVLESAYSNTLPVQEGESENRAGLRQSSSQEETAPAASAGSFGQCASKTTTKRPVRKCRNK